MRSDPTKNKSFDKALWFLVISIIIVIVITIVITDAVVVVAFVAVVVGIINSTFPSHGERRRLPHTRRYLSATL